MTYTIGKPLEFQIGSALENSLNFEARLKTDKIYPSSSSGCDRRSVAMTLLPDSLTETQTIVNQMYFKIGSAIENVVVWALNSSGLLVCREFVAKREWKGAKVSGRIDAIIELEDDPTLYPVEIKSCGASLPKEPKPHHRAQLTTYMTITGMHHGFLIYVSRTVGDYRQRLKYKIFPVVLGPKAVAECAMSLARILFFVNAKTLPKIPFDNPKPCKYCPLITYCWPDSSSIRVEKLDSMSRFEVDDATHTDMLVAASILADRIIDQQPAYLDETISKVRESGEF